MNEAELVCYREVALALGEKQHVIHCQCVLLVDRFADRLLPQMFPGISKAEVRSAGRSKAFQLVLRSLLQKAMGWK